MEKTYVDPSVKLIDSSESYAGFFLWMKSRQEVITSLDGVHFMKDCQLTPNWYYALPNIFMVGDEKVYRDQYYEKIDKMNLQYNNAEYLLFEINGSCLFRDLCYTMMCTAQFAESNRFLFSILDENARYESKYYKISSEYKDIPEWEAQFERYMQKIKEDPIVDHNRREMPYSISSRFWFGCNRRQLIALISFMRNECHFLYEVYGKLLMSQSDIEKCNLYAGANPLTEQHLLVEEDVNNFKEGVEHVHGEIYVSTKIGLILYSQFARQYGAKIRGYFDILCHAKDKEEEFKHKVFKGDTVFNIVYSADQTKVMQTVRTRLCAFAMSSGNDPCSWSYFLNHFIPETITPEQLKQMLPCTWKGNKLVHCKFREDIKFRNEGKEISNCPCPLVSLSLDDAQTKKDRDQNRIGDAFYRLTEWIVTNGLPRVIKMHEWTSDLEIRMSNCLIADEYLVESIKHNVLIPIQEGLSNWKTGEVGDMPDLYIDKLPQPFRDSLGHNGDLTCMLKGLAIDEIAWYLDFYGVQSYLINFGGDIFGKNTEAIIKIEGTDFEIDKKGTFSVFTSGNTEKRGDHIIGGPHGLIAVAQCDWRNQIDIKGNKFYLNWVMDALATKRVARDQDAISLCHSFLKDHVLDGRDMEFQDGIFRFQTYCASPFFNQEQVEIRDRMITKFSEVFRPDLTKSSDEFEAGDNTKALAVVNDNEEGIKLGHYLVYPKNTNDLGTLFEVGYALAHNIIPIQFDEKTNTYRVIARRPRYDISSDPNKKYLFNCSNKLDAISIGYAAAKVKPSQVFYELKGAQDNLMLSVKYTHVEDVDGKYQIFKRDENERDTKL